MPQRLVVFLLLFSSFAFSQTADELIAKNIQAKGGMDKIKAIKTVRMTGKLDAAGGFTGLIGQENMRPSLVRETFTLQGMTQVQAYDGSLVDYKEKGNRVEFLGHDTIDGDDALRLKVTLKDGDIIYYYLDPDTYLEIRKEVQEFIRGSVRDSVVEYGSYKPVAGVMYPFAISQGSKANPAAQTTTIQKIEVNVNINPSDFAVPRALKPEEKGSGLVGVH